MIQELVAQYVGLAVHVGELGVDLAVDHHRQQLGVDRVVVPQLVGPAVTQREFLAAKHVFERRLGDVAHPYLVNDLRIRAPLVVNHLRHLLRHVEVGDGHDGTSVARLNVQQARCEGGGARVVLTATVLADIGHDRLERIQRSEARHVHELNLRVGETLREEQFGGQCRVQVRGVRVARIGSATRTVN